jgi:Tfp pilus assembly protein PilX
MIHANERGIALVMALLVLVAVTMLSVALMVSLSIETKVAGHSVRSSQAMNIAEAGVSEALSRIRNGDVPNNLNPLMEAKIFNAVPGAVPVLGANQVALATGQPAGEWLDYSRATDAPDVLNVRYKTDAARTVIYRYDPNLASPINYTTGFPIFVVTASGRKGPETRRVRAEVIQRPFNTKIEAAMAAQNGIDFSGNSSVCGYNHDMNTPAYTDGVHGGGACEIPWEVGNDDLPGAWSESSVTSTGSANQAGRPGPKSEGQVGFYAGPWEAIGLSQAEFFAWVGAPHSTIPISMNGVFYMDNDGTTQNQSGDWAIAGGNGEGLLYFDGDVAINGNFTFRGLVYIEGDLKINGNCWILGALIVKGKERIKLANGDMTVLYSKDAVVQNLAKFGGQFMTLSWQELP